MNEENLTKENYDKLEELKEESIARSVQVNFDNISLEHVLYVITDRFCIGLGDGHFDLAMGDISFYAKGKGFTWKLGAPLQGQSPDTIRDLLSMFDNPSSTDM